VDKNLSASHAANDTLPVSLEWLDPRGMRLVMPFVEQSNVHMIKDELRFR
jgi:hypothetical protein